MRAVSPHENRLLTANHNIPTAVGNPRPSGRGGCQHGAVRPRLAEAGVEILGYDDLSAAERAHLRKRFESSILPTLTPLTFDPAHPFPFLSNLSLSLAVRTRDDDGEERFSRIKVPENLPRLVPTLPDGDGGNEGDDDASAPDALDASDTPNIPNTPNTPDAGRTSNVEGTRLIPVERVIAANLDLVFPNVEVVGHSTFRVTRNAEVRRNEDVAEGLIERIEDVLRQRRFATLVRLEVDQDTSDAVRDLLVEHLDVSEAEVFERRAPLALSGFAQPYDLDRPDLKHPRWTPQQHPRFAGLDSKRPDELFAEIRDGDALVHHPYHSFSDTVQTFLDAAAYDADTLAIKAAIYRTAPDSRVIRSLIDAAKNGKQVAVMVELKARFDEENNLRWVKRLEEEGIHVAYGSVGLKTHSKVALAVREEGDDVRIYSHVATGNYHSGTANGYVDLGLFTADPDVGQDLVRLFNSFTGHSRHQTYRKLLVAPETLRGRLYELIDREIAHAKASEAEANGDGRDDGNGDGRNGENGDGRGSENGDGRGGGNGDGGNDDGKDGANGDGVGGGDDRGGRIVAKMNALEDPAVVEKLYEAASAGVEIDLIVRGICRLRPGVPGVTDGVRVHSVVGRFLEHSRVFRFGNAGDPDYFAGSADWMTRNLDRRVEAVAPVEEPVLQAELDVILDTMLEDNRRRWTMRPDGSYVQARPAAGEPVRDTHEALMARAHETAPDEDRLPSREPEAGREPNVDLDEVFTPEGDLE